MSKGILLKAVSCICVGAVCLTALAGCGKKETTDNEILLSAMGEETPKQEKYSEFPNSVKKEESVYVNLSPDGKVYGVNVTDWLHTDKPEVRVGDISPLTDIYNVKTLIEPITGDNGRLCWDMNTTDLYYSGKSAAQPPVSFKIQYFLEGEELSYKDIQGKKGNVEIKIQTDCSLKRKVNGYTVTCPFLVVGGTILPEDVFTGISVEGGMSLSDGAKQLAVFAGIPGLDESLGLSKLDLKVIDSSFYTQSYTVSGYTECFELGNLMFAAIPLSAVGSFGNGSVNESIDSVKSVLTDIGNVSNMLKEPDIKKLVDMLSGGSGNAQQLMEAVSDAARLYSENEKLISVVSGYMTEENTQSLNKLIEDLEQTDVDSLSATLSDPKMVQLLKLLPSLSKQVESLTVLADDLNAVMPLFNSLSEDLQDSEVQSALNNLPKTVEQLNSVIATVKENEELLNTVAGFAQGDGAKQLESLMKTMDKYTALGSLSEEQLSDLAERIKAWLDYGAEYDIFTQKTEKMSSSVMFIYKSDAIKAEKSSAPAAKPTETGFTDKIKNLFK